MTAKTGNLEHGALPTTLGRIAGWAMAPFFGVVSFARHARTFHPRGPIYHAFVRVDDRAPVHIANIARRLAGPALVRFSGALWKHAEDVQDVLGCAIRLRRNDEETPVPAADDQDLLFATIRRPYTMPFSPLSTNVEDYLANDYFAVSPFDVGLERRIYLRIHPEHRSIQPKGTRSEKLARDVVKGDARLNLEYGFEPFGPWLPLATVGLKRVAHIDGEALRFRPFRAGRGVRPRGFVHALRTGVYAMSQWARPSLAAATARP